MPTEEILSSNRELILSSIPGIQRWRKNFIEREGEQGQGKKQIKEICQKRDRERDRDREGDGDRKKEALGKE